MKVKELIEKLREVDPEREVIIQRDAEGNGHSLFYELWTGAYDPEKQTVGLEVLTKEDIEFGYTEEDVVKGRKAVILVPS